MANKVPDKKPELEKTAPEGGWGYLIGIGLTLPFACGLGSLHSFGLIFNEFLTDVGAKTSAVTIVTGCFFSGLSFASLISSSLFKKCTMRSVGLFGAFIYFLGSLMIVFVNSVEMLILSFGILQGFGLGLMVPVGYTSFNHYFVKRRVFIMGLVQALKGIIIMLHPIVTNILLNMYGFRGTLAIIAAINAHAIFGMLTMHPIEWHYKVNKTAEAEQTPLMKQTNIHVDFKSLEKYHAIRICSGKQETNSLPNSCMIENSMNDGNAVKTERSKSLIDPKQFEAIDPIQKRLTSIISLKDSGDDISHTNLTDESYVTKSGIWQTIADFLDLTLLKDLIYVNMIIGISCGLFSDNMFSSLLPMYLKSMGFSTDDAAMIVSTGAGTDMFSRVALALISLIFQLKARSIFLAGAIAVILVRTVFLYIFDFTGLVLTMGLIGFFRTWLHVPISLIFAEYLPSERFAAGFGLFMFLQGNFVFVFGPIVGWIRDVTQSYVTFVYSLQFFMCLCVIPWIIEMMWFRIYSKKVPNITEHSQS